MKKSFLLFLLVLLAGGTLQAQCLSGDCKNGTGKMDMGYAVYEGSFKNGQPNGQGTMDYGGGEKYVGGFLAGTEEGEGIMYKGGKQTPVFYRQGVLQVYNKAVVIGGNESTEKVQNCVVGNCRNGYGEMAFPSGNRFKGNFKEGQFSGPGEMRFAGGNIIKADFVAHNPVKGTFYYADVKTLFTGTFNNDGTPNTGTYTSPGIDGIVEVAGGKIISERHPVRDSLRAVAARHALEYGPCIACQGKGRYLHTSWSSFKTERSEWVGAASTGGGYSTYITSKTTGGFSQWMAPCETCGGKGEIKR